MKSIIKMVERTNKFKSWFFYRIYNHMMSMIKERREENIIMEKNIKRLK